MSQVPAGSSVPGIEAMRVTVRFVPDTTEVDAARSEFERKTADAQRAALDGWKAVVASVFDEADRRVESLRRAMSEVSASAPQSSSRDDTSTNPNTGTEPNQLLSKITEIQSSISQIIDIEESILAAVQEP